MSSAAEPGNGKRPRSRVDPPPRPHGGPAPLAARGSQVSFPPAVTPAGPAPTHPGRFGLQPGVSVPGAACPSPPSSPRRSRRPRSQRQAETAARRARVGRAQEIPARFRGSAAAAALRGGPGAGARCGSGDPRPAQPALQRPPPRGAAGPSAQIPADGGRSAPAPLPDWSSSLPATRPPASSFAPGFVNYLDIITTAGCRRRSL